MPSTSASPVPASTPSQLPAYRTGAMLIGIGVGHFVMPKPFDTIVPAELPGSPRFYTLASGVAEIGVGAAMLLPRTRRAAALAAIDERLVRMSTEGSSPSHVHALQTTESLPSSGSDMLSRNLHVPAGTRPVGGEGE